MLYSLNEFIVLYVCIIILCLILSQLYGNYHVKYCCNDIIYEIFSRVLQTVLYKAFIGYLININNNNYLF